MNFTLPVKEVDSLKASILGSFNREKKSNVKPEDVDLYIVRGNYQSRFAIGIASKKESFHLVFYVRGFAAFEKIGNFKMEYCEVAQTGPDSEVWVGTGYLSSDAYPIFKRNSYSKRMEEALNQPPAALVEGEEGGYILAEGAGRILIR